MRRKPKRVSSVVPTALSRGRQKLGHPVPLSNLVSEENSGRPHPAKANTPARFLAIQRAAVGPFGSMLPKHGILSRRQQLPPFGIGVHGFECFAGLHRRPVVRQAHNAEQRQRARARQQDLSPRHDRCSRAESSLRLYAFPAMAVTAITEM
jgi:hypothetical protein